MTADAKTVTVMEIHPNFKTVTVTVIWGKSILKNNKTAVNNFDSNGTFRRDRKRSHDRNHRSGQLVIIHYFLGGGYSL